MDIKNLLNEFKQFAMRGNVVDLAVAVVVGGAFGKIVTSLTSDIIMPVVGVLTGGIDFSDFSWTMKSAVGDVPAVTLNYGLFINAVISFVIVAFAIFTVVKLMNKLQKQKEEVEPVQEEKPSKEEVLLTEIRDVLKSAQEK